MRVELRAAKREIEHLQSVARQQSQLVASLSKQLTDAQMVRMLVNVEHANEDVRIARAVEAEREACAKIADNYYVSSVAGAICRQIRSRTEHAGVAQEEREVVGMKPSAGGGSNAQASPSSADLAFKDRVGAIVMDCCSKWAQATDKRLSALESQQETARRENVNESDDDELDALPEGYKRDYGVAHSGVGNSWPVTSTETITGASAAHPSPQPMTDEELAKRLLETPCADGTKCDWDDLTEGTQVDWILTAREARRLISVEHSKADSEHADTYDMLIDAQSDRSKLIAEITKLRGQVNSVQEDYESSAKANGGLIVEVHTLRARVAELEARKPEMDVERAAKDIAKRIGDGAHYVEPAALQRMLSDWFTPAKPARPDGG